MSGEDQKFGVPVGMDILLLPEEEAVVLRVKLSETPIEDNTVSLAMPADSALTLALALISCVKDLKGTNEEVNALFPPLDPGKGN